MHETLRGGGAGDRSPLVSIIIPGRNVAEFLGDALNSVARQFGDLRDAEIIFVDDGSDDSTPALAEGLSAGFPNFEYMRNPTPQGAYRARNQGIGLARGRYISFLDADDWFAPGHLAVLARAMERLNCDFVRTDIIKAWGTERVLRRAPQGKRGVALEPRDSILPVGTYTMVDHPWSQAGMYHRRLIDRGLLRFPLGISTAEDRPWIWGLHLNADSYAVVDAPGFVWRKGVDSSLTSSFDRRRLDYLKAMDHVRTIVEQDVEAERFMPKVIQSVLALTEHHMESYERLPDDVKREFIDGARTLLGKFPPEMLSERIAASGPERRRRLARVLRGFGDGRASR